MSTQLDMLDNMVSHGLADSARRTPEGIRELIASVRQAPIFPDVTDDDAEMLAREIEEPDPASAWGWDPLWWRPMISNLGSRMYGPRSKVDPTPGITGPATRNCFSRTSCRRMSSMGRTR